MNVPKANFTDNKTDARFDFFLNPRTTAFFRWSWHHGNIVDAEPITGAGGWKRQRHDSRLQQADRGRLHFPFQPELHPRRACRVYLDPGRQDALRSWPAQPDRGRQESLACPPRRSSRARSTIRPSPASRSSARKAAIRSFRIRLSSIPRSTTRCLHGRNSIKVGYEYQAINTEIDDFNPTYGNDNYGGGFSSGASNANAGAYTGNGDAGIKEAAYLTDFLVGARSNYTLNNFVIVNYHQMMNFFYVQDDLKVSTKLTVNAGLRYELVTPQWVTGNHLADFIPPAGTASQAPYLGITTGTLQQASYGPIPAAHWSTCRRPISLRASVSPMDGTIKRWFAADMGSTTFSSIARAAKTCSPITAPTSSTRPSRKQSQHRANEHPICRRDVQNDLMLQPDNAGLQRKLRQPCRVQHRSGRDSLYSQRTSIPAMCRPGISECSESSVKALSSTSPTLENTESRSGCLTISTRLAPNTPSSTCEFNTATNSFVTTGCVPLLNRRPIVGFTGIEGSANLGMLIYHGVQARVEHRYSNGLYLLNAFYLFEGHRQRIGPSGHAQQRQLAREPGQP